MQDFEVIRSLTPGEDVLVLLPGQRPQVAGGFRGGAPCGESLFGAAEQVSAV